MIIFAVLISGCTGQKTDTKTDNMTEKPNTVLIKGFACNVFSSGNLNNGQSYAHTLNETGTFEYHCSIHPSMSGKVIVTTV